LEYKLRPAGRVINLNPYVWVQDLFHFIGVLLVKRDGVRVGVAVVTLGIGQVIATLISELGCILSLFMVEF
jgi:hypothetical protein